MRVAKHGGPTLYRAGCRCDECVFALPHGTKTGYCTWACRCDACTLAAFPGCDIERLKAKREGHAKSPMFRAGCRCRFCDQACPHGSLSGSQHWRCRCTLCQDAAREFNKVEYQRPREQSRQDRRRRNPEYKDAVRVASKARRMLESPEEYAARLADGRRSAKRLRDRYREATAHLRSARSEPWTADEDAILRSPGLTAIEKAFLTGRKFNAVAHRIETLKRRERTERVA